jgi:hypothetical protein
LTLGLDTPTSQARSATRPAEARELLDVEA